MKWMAVLSANIGRCKTEEKVEKNKNKWNKQKQK